MSAEIVNLRRVRKAAARVQRADDAAEARARHGRTKAERAVQEAEAGRLRAIVDGARRETPDGRDMDGHDR